MSTDLASFKAGQRKLWAAGDYAVTARRFEGVAAELVEAGTARCTALGEWEIPWSVADVEELPFADGRFDAVLSVFGLVFAPRPEVAIAEAFRVTRSGGTVAFTSWTPGSAAARFGE